MLRGHRGLVKGVAWDPVGRYVASQADDRTLVVWRTSDWGQEVVITKPFEEVCSLELFSSPYVFVFNLLLIIFLPTPQASVDEL